MALNAVGLWHEVTTRVANVNDDAFHWAFIQRGIDAIEHGENVLEFWVPQIGLGFPQFLYYQHLPHVFVIALYEALFRSVDAYTLFNFVRWVLLVTLPVTVFWSLRRIGLSAAGAAFGAAASGLLSTPYLYGFDYQSYVWRGFGMYTQLWAMHLSFIALAFSYDVTQRGRGLLGLILSLSTLAISHILYAYMAIVTLGVLLVVGISRANAGARIARVAVAGIACGLITSYMTVPTLLSAATYSDYGPYLERWKFDSFGAPKVLEYFAKGQLFDDGRLPVFSALVVAGIVVTLVVRSRVAIAATTLFAAWLVLFFGRPTLGPVADILPLQNALLFHRFLGGVHLAGIVLIGIAGGYLYERLRPEDRWLRAAAAIALLALALVPALRERADYYATQRGWVDTTVRAIDGDADASTVLTTIAALPPGRVFAGAKSEPGMDFGIPFNSVQFRHLLTWKGIPEASTPYAGPSLNADLLYDLDVRRPEHDDLFNVRYVVAPTGRVMPAELRPILTTRRYTLYEAPTTGYAGYVTLADRRAVSSQPKLFAQNRAWLASADLRAKRFIRWDYPAASDGSVGQGTAGCQRGGSLHEEIGPSRLTFVVECLNDAPLVIKVTYHPNWHVWVDGSAVPTFMASPSYIGVELAAGRHTVVAEYRSTPMKGPLLGLGVLGVVGAAFADRILRRRVGWWAR